MRDTETLFREWLTCPAMPEELQDELRAMDGKQKNDSFYRELSFGTGGLRGILGAGTNRMNVFTVLRATRGLGAYLKEKYPERKFYEIDTIQVKGKTKGKKRTNFNNNNFWHIFLIFSRWNNTYAILWLEAALICI